MMKKKLDMTDATKHKENIPSFHVPGSLKENKKKTYGYYRND